MGYYERWNPLLPRTQGGPLLDIDGVFYNPYKIAKIHGFP